MSLLPRALLDKNCFADSFKWCWTRVVTVYVARAAVSSLVTATHFAASDLGNRRSNTSTEIGLLLVVIKGEVKASFSIAARKAKQNRSDTHMANVIPSTAPITLFVRMADKLRKHRTRFYCDLLRTAVLFLPASFGKTVVVLDEKSEHDHVFANGE